MDNNPNSINPNPSPTPEPTIPPTSPQPTTTAQSSPATVNEPVPNISAMTSASPIIPQKHHKTRTILIVIGLIFAILFIIGLAITLIVRVVEDGAKAEIKIGDLTAQYSSLTWNEIDDEDKSFLPNTDTEQSVTLESSLYGRLFFTRFNFSSTTSNSSFTTSEYFAKNLQSVLLLANGLTNPSSISTVAYNNISWSTFTGQIASKNTDMGFWVYADVNTENIYVIIYQAPLGHYDTLFELSVQDILKSIKITNVIDSSQDNSSTFVSSVVGEWDWGHNSYFVVRPDGSVTVYTNSQKDPSNAIEGTYTTDPVIINGKNMSCDGGLYIKISTLDKTHTNEYCILEDSWSSSPYTMYNLTNGNVYYGNKVK